GRGHQRALRQLTGRPQHADRYRDLLAREHVQGVRHRGGTLLPDVSGATWWDQRNRALVTPTAAAPADDASTNHRPPLGSLPKETAVAAVSIRSDNAAASVHPRIGVPLRAAISEPRPRAMSLPPSARPITADPSRPESSPIHGRRARPGMTMAAAPRPTRAAARPSAARRASPAYRLSRFSTTPMASATEVSRVRSTERTVPTWVRRESPCPGVRRARSPRSAPSPLIGGRGAPGPDRRTGRRG